MERLRFNDNNLQTARELLSLSPELQTWAMEGYELGAIRKDELFRNNVVQLRSEFETANHENGHAAVARALGWDVVSISIVRDGNTLGVTKAVPGTAKPMDQLLLDKMAICFAGMAAESISGNNDHRGCGSDMAQVNNLASILSRVFYNGAYSPGDLIQSQYSRAQGIMRDLGNKELNNRSWWLLQKKAA